MNRISSWQKQIKIYWMLLAGNARYAIFLCEIIPLGSPTVAAAERQGSRQAAGHSGPVAGMILRVSTGFSGLIFYLQSHSTFGTLDSCERYTKRSASVMPLLASAKDRISRRSSIRAHNQYHHGC